jgi:hypothetical protein
VSFQITVLKVLAGHPGGSLSLDDLKRAVAILMSSGPDWTDRTNHLLSRAPGLDIFGQSFVIHDAQGWQITDAGRASLAAIESPANGSAVEVQTSLRAEKEPMRYSTSAPLLAAPVARRHGQRSRRKRRRSGRSAA